MEQMLAKEMTVLTAFSRAGQLENAADSAKKIRFLLRSLEQ